MACFLLIFEPCNNATSTIKGYNPQLIQLNSESFRQDKFKDELSYRTRVREHRRMSKNLLVSSDRDDAVL
ncbi:palindromic element RPE3 domain-containing protein [Rickettsia endosymbiont of Ceutorhynchus obstrictus]|uniref:palindromic element RPE3 domain-containing protein n=1 Tax=unclassified Rickettsia TaxID=114295 RepID=UPI00397BC778